MIATNFEYVDSGRLQKLSVFIALPQRLIYKILSELSFYDLLRCKQTCRVLDRIISGIPALQYKIELAATGMEDVPQNRLCVAKKLTTLRNYRRAWADLSWTTFGQCVSKPFESAAWDFSSGVLSHNIEDSGLSFVQPGSEILNIPESSWALQFAHPFTSYFTEPSQDLLILVFSEEEAESSMKIRSLRTGLDHPKAETNILELSGPYGATDEFCVYEDKLACLSVWDVSGWNGCLLTVWNWHTGKIILSYDSVIHSELQTQSDDIIRWDYTNCTFLDATHIVLSVCPINKDQVAYSALIQVIDISLGDKAVACGVNFALPALSEKACIDTLGMTRNATRNIEMCRCPPFQIADDKAVVAITMEVKELACENYELLTFFFPTGRLLDAYKLASGNPSARNVPWQDWGPVNTRLLPELTIQELRMSVSGTRFAWRDNGHIVLADFNVLGARANESFPDGMCEEGYGSVVLEPIPFESWSLKEEITTCLPYRFFSTKLKIGEDDKGVFLSENTLMINDETEELHLLLTV